MNSVTQKPLATAENGLHNDKVAILDAGSQYGKVSVFGHNKSLSVLGFDCFDRYFSIQFKRKLFLINHFLCKLFILILKAKSVWSKQISPCL